MVKHTTEDLVLRSPYDLRENFEKFPTVIQINYLIGKEMIHASLDFSFYNGQ
jgi:hypothetical protein